MPWVAEVTLVPATLLPTALPTTVPLTVPPCGKRENECYYTTLTFNFSPSNEKKIFPLCVQNNNYVFPWKTYYSS